MAKENSISVRLNSEVKEKLQTIVKVRGVSESEAIRLCITNAVIVPLGDAKQLSEEFCKIRIALEKESIDEELREEVTKLCRYISDVLQKAENLVKLLNE